MKKVKFGLSKSDYQMIRNIYNRDVELRKVTTKDTKDAKAVRNRNFRSQSFGAASECRSLSKEEIADLYSNKQ